MLTRTEIAEALATLPRWELNAGCLVRQWTMESFEQAISFVNQVADIAEAAGHHPDIDIRYTKVQLSLISHDVSGLTARDVALARVLDRAFSGAEVCGDGSKKI